MTPGNTIKAGDMSEEVVALITTLHATEQRLEELTAGEVDAVADPTGRTFVLRHAQEQLRHSEALRQAAILNALAANIAVLDSRGLIISVNEAWRSFAKANLIRGKGCGIGLNYLEICDGAQGADSAEACEVAAGIRSVLAGEVDRFSIEYPCHSPTQQRWFLLTATPLADARPNGAVVMHLDMTTERQAKESLRASELRFRLLIENVSDLIIVAHADGVLTYVSPSMREVGGYEPADIIGRSLFEFIHPDDKTQGTKVMAEIGSSPGAPVRAELRFRHRNGSWQTLESICTNLLQVPAIGGVLVTARNVTERNQIDIRVKRLNRVYAVLSGINTLIVRSASRAELFREACRIAVDDGGFRMAMIAIVDPVSMVIVPVASAGKDQTLLKKIGDRLVNREAAKHTMVMRAIMEKKAVIANNSREDAQVVFGHEYAESGVRSVAVLPLMTSGKAAGVLALYAGEIDFFHADELKLLTELTDDVAFAMDHLDKTERLDYLAYYDVLTGLANRSLFLERLAQSIRSAIGSGHKLAVYLIDLERFRDVNESLGRPAGDLLLRKVAEWLTLTLKDASLLARVGADHFAVVLPIVSLEGEVAAFLETLLGAFLGVTFRLNDAELRISARVGVAIFPDDGADAETILNNAESAVTTAKTSGDRYLFYKQKMTETVANRLTLENQLRHALENDEFVLHYQPKVNLMTGKLTGAEALIRWSDPRTGLVPPGQFITILEETGLIHAVGRWALHQAIEDYRRWRNAGLPAVRIAVNVSSLQLRDRGFIDEIKRAIGTDTQAAAGLELEITESLIMENVRRSIDTLQAIRDLGVGIAIDDFGTGYSSLSYLSRLPVDTLKIDRSFVLDMTVTPEALSLVSAIINLAHALKLKVVAEGVETEEQSRLLRVLNCDEMQGFLFSKAVPREIFEASFLVSGSSA